MFTEKSIPILVLARMITDPAEYSIVLIQPVFKKTLPLISKHGITKCGRCPKQIDRALQLFRQAPTILAGNAVADKKYSMCPPPNIRLVIPEITPFGRFFILVGIQRKIHCRFYFSLFIILITNVTTSYILSLRKNRTILWVAKLGRARSIIVLKGSFFTTP